VATFAVSAANNTVDADGSARLVSFGVDVVNPQLAAAGTGATSEWIAAIKTTFPGFKQVDLCSYAGSNCAGGQSNGVLEGELANTFDLILPFSSLTFPNDGSGAGITVTSPFPSKWQSVGAAGKSYEVDGCFYSGLRQRPA
jgi:hypothetical protein